MAQQGLGRFNEFYDTLAHTPQGFAASFGAERMAGYAGAVTRAENAQKNLETALGRDFDGPMTTFYNVQAKLTQSFVEADAATRHLAEGAVLATAAVVAFEGALKAGAIVQNVSGNAAGAAAITRLGGGAAGRMALLGGMGIPVGMLAYLASQAEYHPDKAKAAVSDVQQWAGIARDKAGDWAKAHGIGLGFGHGEAASSVFDRMHLMKAAEGGDKKVELSGAAAASDTLEDALQRAVHSLQDVFPWCAVATWSAQSLARTSWRRWLPAATAMCRAS